MATITEQIYKKVIPESENDSNYEAFEFVLAWYGRDGQLIVKMFTDWEANDQTDTANINLSDKNNLQNVIGGQKRDRTLTAEDLTLNDLQVLSSIFEAKKIIRVYKNGSFERIGLSANSFKYRQTDARYNLTIKVILCELALPR